MYCRLSKVLTPLGIENIYVSAGKSIRQSFACYYFCRFSIWNNNLNLIFVSTSFKQLFLCFSKCNRKAINLSFSTLVLFCFNEYYVL